MRCPPAEIAEPGISVAILRLRRACLSQNAHPAMTDTLRTEDGRRNRFALGSGSTNVFVGLEFVAAGE